MNSHLPVGLIGSGVYGAWVREAIIADALAWHAAEARRSGGWA